jgi:hypothetical protein
MAKLAVAGTLGRVHWTRLVRDEFLIEFFGGLAQLGRRHILVPLWSLLLHFILRR